MSGQAVVNVILAAWAALALASLLSIVCQWVTGPPSARPDFSDCRFLETRRSVRRHGGFWPFSKAANCCWIAVHGHVLQVGLHAPFRLGPWPNLRFEFTVGLESIRWVEVERDVRRRSRVTVRFDQPSGVEEMVDLWLDDPDGFCAAIGAGPRWAAWPGASAAFERQV